MRRGRPTASCRDYYNRKPLPKLAHQLLYFEGRDRPGISAGRVGYRDHKLNLRAPVVRWGLSLSGDATRREVRVTRRTSWQVFQSQSTRVRQRQYGSNTYWD